MLHKKAKKEPGKARRTSVMKEMAKQRMAKSHKNSGTEKQSAGKSSDSG